MLFQYFFYSRNFLLAVNWKGESRKIEMFSTRLLGRCTGRKHEKPVLKQSFLIFLT